MTTSFSGRQSPLGQGTGVHFHTWAQHTCGGDTAGERSKGIGGGTDSPSAWHCTALTLLGPENTTAVEQ